MILRRSILFVCAVAALLATAGCEEDVTAVLGSERAYTLYGVVSPALDTQAVLVFPIEPTLAERPAAPLPARVTSTNLTTGEARVWRDSLVTGLAGSPEHVFWSDFNAAYGHAYRIRVEGDDGRAAEVQVTVPERAEIALDDAAFAFGNVTQVVRVTAPVPRVLAVEVAYRVRTSQDAGPEGITQYRVDYTDRARKTAEGWIIPLNLTRDHDDLETIASGWSGWSPAMGLTLLDMQINLIVADAAWDPPGGTFDPDVLVQPGVFSNVENGFGFVGAGYRLRRLWLPNVDLVRRAGWGV